jgi:hypothetical protein
VSAIFYVVLSYTDCCKLAIYLVGLGWVECDGAIYCVVLSYTE